MIAPAVQAILAFNLVCTGTMRSGPLGLALPEAEGAPIAVTYRLDLDARLWCSDACDAPEPLASVTDAELVLRDRHDPAGSHVIGVSLATARFTDTLIAGDTAVLRSGQCRAEPFAGFPDRSA